MPPQPLGQRHDSFRCESTAELELKRLTTSQMSGASKGNATCRPEIAAQAECVHARDVWGRQDRFQPVRCEELVEPDSLPLEWPGRCQHPGDRLVARAGG